MAKTSTSATGTNNERGVTLLELLVVIALIGVLSALGAQALRTDTERARLGDRIEQRLHEARLAARESGVEVTLACEGLGRISSPEAHRTAPNKSAPSVRCLRSGLPAEAIAFYPDGSAAGGIIELTAGGQVLRLAVEPFLGQITRDD